MSSNTDSSNDEKLRKCLKPDPTQEQVLEAILKTYRQDAKIVKELESYDDRNYLVELDSTKYLCKVYNGVESAKFMKASEEANSDKNKKALSSIHLYSLIWNHINSQSGLSTSSPIPIPDHTYSFSKPHVSVHSLPVTSSEHSPAPLALQLLEWVEGSTMADSSSLPIETLIEAGQYLGKVRIALDELTETNEVAKATADRYHAWDGKNTLDLQGFLPCIIDEKRRGLVQSVLDAFRHDLVDGDSPNFQMGILQGDFNDANIILDQSGKVSGVIDFGDTTLSWRILDLTIAMAYAMLSSYGKGGRGISAAAAILRGFNSICPLTAEERKHLRLLVASRLSCSVTLGAYSYQQNPQNEYLLLHAQPAWNALGLLWGSDNANVGKAIDDMFDQACDGCATDVADISFADPTIPDVMKSARVLTNSIQEPPTKKARTMTRSEEKPVITFVTGNKKKLEEVKRILATDSLPFIISNEKIDLPELQGDPIEIAKEKCALAAKEVGGAVITEDTSLCFTALDSLPGPYIKWFLEKCGHQGLNDMIAFTEDKSGYAQTVVGFCPGPGQDVIVFDGRTMGKICPPRGDMAFGWDPIFAPEEGNGLTYAEMTKEGKDAISHRGRAFGKLRTYFQEEAETITTSIKSKS